MSREGFGFLVTQAVVSALLVTACRDGHAHDDAVARLVDLHGVATKEAEKKPATWNEVTVGAPFALGDAVRTAPGATATVELVAGRRLHLGGKTTVRFLTRGARATNLSVETGEAEVEPGDSALGVETSIGMAQIEPGSRVKLATADRRLSFDVLIGSAEFDPASDGGSRRSISAGHRLLIDIGGASVERDLSPVDGAVADARVEAQADAGTSDATTAQTEGATEPWTADVRGNGARVAPSRSAPLGALAQGAVTLVDGSHLVVAEGTTVVLSRGGERIAIVGASDVDIVGGSARRLRATSGRFLIRSKQPGGRVEVPGGYVELEKAGLGDVQADVRVDRRTTHVLSNHGELLLHGGLRSANLGPGESGMIDARGDATVDAVAITESDVALPAGESATIHSPKGFAAVQIRVPNCKGDSLVQVGSRGNVRRTFARADDPKAGILRLSTGTYAYKASCVDGDTPDQHGTVRVVADSGVARLARTAPSNTVDADGRRYHVLYQSVLPQMTFRWPEAPAGRALTFHATSAGRDRKLPAPGGTIALPSGAMAEGTYRYWFDVDGEPTRRSRETTLVLGFDNAAPAAEIRAPAEGEPIAATVHVAGVALDGSTVSVSGTPIPLDAEARFSGDVPGPDGNHVMAIRIAHPVRGVHYFLRTFVAGEGR